MSVGNRYAAVAKKDGRYINYHTKKNKTMDDTVGRNLCKCTCTNSAGGC